MLAKPIPTGDGKIGKLAQAALTGNFENMASALQRTVDAYKANIAADTEITPENRENELREAVARYINTPQKNLNEQTVLHLTAHFPRANDSDLGAMVFLLKYGANPNAQDANGNTLMHHYASKCIETAVVFVKTHIGGRRPEEAQEAIAIINLYMTRMCTLAYYLGDPTLTNIEGKSTANILQEFDKYLEADTGLHIQVASCYLSALKGATPPGKVEVTIPQNILLASQPEGPQASKVSAGRAANENQKKATCCVLL